MQERDRNVVSISGKRVEARGGGWGVGEGHRISACRSDGDDSKHRPGGWRKAWVKASMQEEQT
jgi:hypothetical protein